MGSRPGLFNRGNDRWRREEVDEGTCGFGLLRVFGKTDGEDRNPLNLVWQWTHVVDACHGKQLADLLKANLRIASRHDGADPLADNPLGLGSQLLRDSESWKELGGKVGPAGARRICNGPGLEQRAHQGIDRADIRFRGALAHGHPDARSRQIGACPRYDLPSLDELVERVCREDHEVGRLTAGEAEWNRIGRTAHRCAEDQRHLVLVVRSNSVARSERGAVKPPDVITTISAGEATVADSRSVVTTPTAVRRECVEFIEAPRKRYDFDRVSNGAIINAACRAPGGSKSVL